MSDKDCSVEELENFPVFQDVELEKIKRKDVNELNHKRINDKRRSAKISSDLKMNENKSKSDVLLNSQSEIDLRNLPFIPNKWPTEINSHIKRKYFELIRNDPRSSSGEASFLEEASTHCIICGKDSTKGPLMSCKGLTLEVMKKPKVRVKCKSVFHLSCITEYNASDYCCTYIVQPECQNELLCPLHFCDTCYFDRRKQSAFTSRLIECALCLRAFHYDVCTPAGAKDVEVSLNLGDEVVTIEMIICPSHRIRKESKKKLHLPVCCECERKNGEELVHCRNCIRSFHLSCRSVETVDGKPVSQDECEFCLSEECIRYDAPVIARWTGKQFFPAVTRDWSKCPNALRKDSRYDQLGYITLEWVSEGKPEFSISTIDDCVPIFETSLEYLGKTKKEAYRAAWRKLIDCTDEIIRFPPILKEVRKKIDTARYTFKDGEKTAFIEPEKYICDCPVNGPNRCSTDQCSNRRVLYECPPECNEKGKCMNRNISEKVVNKSIERRETLNKGFGIFATSNIKKGEFIAEYAGEIINKQEMEKRNSMISYARDSEANLYMMSLSNGRAVDAARAGNIARYLNHSCDPNCQTVKKTILIRDRKSDAVYDYRIAIIAIKNIQAGEELTFTYRMDDVVNTQAPKCKCGAENCSGSLGKNLTDLNLDESTNSLEDTIMSDIRGTGQPSKKQSLLKRPLTDSGDKDNSFQSFNLPKKKKTRDIKFTPCGNIEISTNKDKESLGIIIREMVGTTCLYDGKMYNNVAKRLWNMTSSKESMYSWMYEKILEDLVPHNAQFNPKSKEIEALVNKYNMSAIFSNSASEGSLVNLERVDEELDSIDDNAKETRILHDAESVLNKSSMIDENEKKSSVKFKDSRFKKIKSSKVTS